MRRFLIVALAACSGAPSRVEPTAGIGPVASRPTKTKHVVPVRPSAFPPPPVDVLALLGTPREHTGTIVPGPAALVLGGTSLQPIDDTPIDVDLIEERGSEVRLGIRMRHARFAVWTERASMLAVLSREAEVMANPQEDPPAANMQAAAMLERGTRVRRLARRGAWTQIRYAEQVQVEGWILDDALGDSGVANSYRQMFGRKQLSLAPGAAIRVSVGWHARILGVVRFPAIAENIETLADGWYEVLYRDSDVRVRGYVSPRSPSVPYTPRPRRDVMSPLATNATVPADTCLFAGGEPIGAITGDRAVLLEPASAGAFTLTIDTPWGAVPFEARGLTATDLERCASSSP